MNRGYEIIDAHCHVYKDKIAKKASDATNAFYDINGHCDGTISMLLEKGDEAGFDKYVIQSVATTPKQVAGINEFIAESVASSNGIFFGLGTLHPDSEDIEGDVEHIISLGLHGVKLHPDIQRFKIDDYRCLKIYELCEKYKLPILMHTGDKRYDYSNPNRLLPVLDIYTDLILVGAHLGGWSTWEEASKELHGINNLYVDCSSCFYWLENDKVKEIIERYGTDRVLFGTDYPMWSPPIELERFFELGFDEDTNRKILSENAKRVYGIE